MEREAINNKKWYRAVKVFFFLSLILIQILGIIITNSLVSGRKVDPSSFAHAGSVIKTKFPEYWDLNDQQVGLYVSFKFVNGVMSGSQFQEFLNRGFTFNEIANFFTYRDKHSLIEKAGFYLLSIFVITLIFWVIERIFFYIFLGEKFIRLY